MSGRYVTLQDEQAPIIRARARTQWIVAYCPACYSQALVNVDAVRDHGFPPCHNVGVCPEAVE